MAEGCSLFTKPISPVQAVSAFTFFAKSGAMLKVQVQETPAQRVNFVDVRKVLHLWDESEDLRD